MTKSINERFLEKVSIGDDCWEWQGGLNTGGYGQLFKKKDQYRHQINILAHIFSYQLFYKISIPDNKLVLHTCDNRKCVNPKHLFLGNVTINNLDKYLKGRDDSTVTLKNAEQIRKEYSEGNITQKELGKKYFVDQSQISRIVNNKARFQCQ